MKHFSYLFCAPGCVYIDGKWGWKRGKVDDQEGNNYYLLRVVPGIEEDWLENVLQKQRCSGITYKTYLMDKLLHIVAVASQPSEC